MFTIADKAVGQHEGDSKAFQDQLLWVCSHFSRKSVLRCIKQHGFSPQNANVSIVFVSPKGQRVPLASLGTRPQQEAAGAAPERPVHLSPSASPRLLHWRFHIFSAAGACVPGHAEIPGARTENQRPSLR